MCNAGKKKQGSARQVQNQESELIGSDGCPIKKKKEERKKKKKSKGRETKRKHKSTRGGPTRSQQKQIAAKQKGINKTAKGGVKKARKYKPGTVALREIKKYQKSTDLLIRKAPFQRLVREITQDITDHRNLRFQSAAIMALQEAAEAYLVRLFENGLICAIHAKRVTVMPRDFHLVQRIRDEKCDK